MSEPADTLISSPALSYPSLAQIAGHAMSSIFLDSLAVDIERILRINQTLSLIPNEARKASSLRPVELLVISPSERIDQIAAEHTQDLPHMVRALLGALGADPSSPKHGKVSANSGALTSYLLFEAAFTRELMALGHKDALQQEDAIRKFFGWV
jgi:NTE family protein